MSAKLQLKSISITPGSTGFQIQIVFKNMGVGKDLTVLSVIPNSAGLIATSLVFGKLAKTLLQAAEKYWQ